MGRTPNARAPFRWAAALLIAQGVLMEGLVAVGLVGLVLAGVPQAAILERTTVFALSYLQENLYLMMSMSGIFGVLRVIGAVAMWRNRLWGLALSVVNCVVTLTLMVFLLPPGLVDGVLSGTALVLVLYGWLGRAPDGSPRTIDAR
jgi:hypothetical protein